MLILAIVDNCHYRGCLPVLANIWADHFRR